MLKIVLLPLAGLALAIALAMLWYHGEREKDRFIKSVAIIGFVAFLLLVFALGGDSED